ncbi:MAG: ABC transporter ATP-binding protein [Propionicimonas sp.]
MDRSLDVVGLGYRYPRGESDVLQGVDLSFPAGSFTVVMGQTGAGKSTLLMTLNGVIPHLKEGRLAGRVLLDGTDLAGFRVQTITEYVGLVLQDPESQLLGRTVAEDVAFGPRNYLVPRGEVTRRVADGLASVGLTGFEHRETAGLSGGEKQRVAIAGILALRPRVLCLDEPTSELDPHGRDELYATVDALRQDRETTIIAVEHASSDVVHRADHLVVLAGGRVVWQGRPGDFFRDPALVAAHGVKPLPVGVIGGALAAAGLDEAAAVPLSVDAAEALVRRLAAGRPLPAPPASPAGPRPGSEAAVELRDVSYTYPGGHRGLTGVSLRIDRGEFVALVGRNGAGKTTLAKHLNGLLRPTGGTVVVGGRDAATLAPWELARQVGYVFQNPDHQVFCPTVAAEVRYGLKLAGLATAEIEARVDEALGFTGLAAVRDEHPFSLGKGERQRLAVASILALRPGILVVDEPTTGQDWAGVQAMMTLVDRLNAGGTTIVMVTHDLDVVAHHARRVVVLGDGGVLADGPTPEVLGSADILAAAAVTTTQPAELSLRLWPEAPPLLDEAALGAHLAAVLTGVAE